MLQPLSLFANATPELKRVYESHRASSRYSNREEDVLAGISYDNVEYVYGYVSAQMWEMAVTSIVDKLGVVSAGEISGERIKNELELGNISFGDFGGLTAGPVSFTAGDHRPQNAVEILKLDADGKLVSHLGAGLSIELRAEWLGW